MSGLVQAVAWLGYAVSVLLSFRWLYGHLRARSIDYNVREYGELYKQDPVAEWNKRDRGFVVLAAAGLALIWPLALLGYLLAHPLGAFLARSPVRSRWEIAHEREQRDARIAELEAENERLRQKQARDAQGGRQ